MQVKILLLFIAIILFNGCSGATPAPEVKIVEKKVYIKAKERQLINKPKIPVYEIIDINDYNATHVLVNDAQLQKASKVSMQRYAKILFYENQNRGLDAIK